MSNPFTKGKLARPAFTIRPQLTPEEVRYVDSLDQAVESLKKVIRFLKAQIAHERRALKTDN